MAESLEDEAEEALERALAPEDLTQSHQTQLDGMAKKFMDTCHLVADQLELHQKVGGRAPLRVAARVRRAIEHRRGIIRDLRQAESQGDWGSVAHLEEMYMLVKSKAQKVICVTGQQTWYKTIREAHVNMRERPRYY